MDFSHDTSFAALPQLDNVLRESSEWIARLNADDVSSNDRARFERWLNSHPLRARTYAELNSTWLMLLARRAGANKSRRSAVETSVQ